MSRPLKILYVIDCLAKGGTELQLCELIDRLDREKFEPHLCTLRPSPASLTPGDCPHWALDVPRLLSPGGMGAAWRLSRRLRREEFAVVQTFFQDGTIFGGVAARLADTPVRLASFRDLGFWRTGAQELLLRRVYPMMTGFVANSADVRDHFISRDGLDPAFVEVIHNGIDPADWPWVDHEEPTLDIGLVGNLNRRVKRADLFLEAAAIVAQDQPQVTWHVIGEGSYRAEYEELAEKLGIAERVVFAGSVTDVRSYLARMQVGVLCSDSEGFSNALLEYMLCGCAPVVTAVGGNPEAVGHDYSGLLVPPNDPRALATAMASLVHDVSLRRRLAASARADAVSRFGWSSCLAAHEAVYLKAE